MKLFPFISFALITSYILSGCSIAGTQTNIAVQLELLNHHQQLWENLKIHNYQIYFQRSCFCRANFTRTIKLHIENDQILTASYVDNQGAVANEVMNSVQSVNALFNLIKEAIAQSAEQVVVEYDQSHYYPTKAFINKHGRIADDEFTITLSQLTIK